MIYQTGGSISLKNQRKKTTDGQEATTGQAGQTKANPGGKMGKEIQEK